MKRTKITSVSRRGGWPSRYAPAPTKVELKYSAASVAVTVPVTGTVVNIMLVANGTGPNERIGRSITLHDLEFYLQTVPVSAAGVDAAVRYIIVYDSQGTAGLPAVNEILDSAAVQSLPNATNRGRFKFLWDRTFTYNLDSAVGVQSGLLGRAWPNQRISMKGKKTEFLTSASGIAGIDKGAVYLVAVTNANNTQQVRMESRIQFYD